MSELKKKLNLNERKVLTSKILDKYPEKCPVFLSIDNKQNSIHLSRYIVTYNLTMLQFLVIVRKKINIGAEESLTLFIEVFNNNKIITIPIEKISKAFGIKFFILGNNFLISIILKFFNSSSILSIKYIMIFYNGEINYFIMHCCIIFIV